MKKIIKLNIKKLKDPNRREANQLAIYKRGRGVELVGEEPSRLEKFLDAPRISWTKR